MKKLLSYVIVFSMLVSSFSILLPSTKVAKAAPKNTPATFIANRFIKVGFDRDGLPLYPKRLFPWQKTAKIQVWGNDRFPMANAKAPLASVLVMNPCTGREERINVPGVVGQTDVYPVLWCEFYLTITPDGGKSQESNKRYVVLDSANQLWMDPDGTFNDPRYNPYADPKSCFYDGIGCRTASAKVNGTTVYAVDPASDNNTQGPYYLTNNGQVTVDLDGRQFQMGFVDMVDYPPERLVTLDGGVTYDTYTRLFTNPGYSNKPNDEGGVAFQPTEVLPYQWDLGLPLVNFRTKWYTDTTPDPIDWQVSEGDEMFHEYHARKRNSPYWDTTTGTFNFSYTTRTVIGYGVYDPYEYIYRKGPGNLDPQTADPASTLKWFSAPQPIVQVGDIRLCDMSFRTWDGSTVKNYMANSLVKPWDADAPQDYDHNNLLEGDEVRYIFFFPRYVKHTEAVIDGRDFSNPLNIANIKYDVTNDPNLGYTVSEWIYADSDFTSSTNTLGDGIVTTKNPTNAAITPDYR